MTSALVNLQLDIAIIKLSRAFARKYRPDQPRVPAGSGRESGRFTDADGSGSGRIRLAQGDRIEGYTVDLREEEARGGHTIRDHVGKSADHLVRELRDRQLAAIRNGNRADGLRVGSFDSLDSATRLVNSTIAKNPEAIEKITREGWPFAMARAQFDSVTGSEAYARTERSDPRIRETYGVSVLLIRDPLSRRRYRVHTAFPSN